MFDTHAYLRSEFKRYFPNARIHVITTNGGETIDVGVIPEGSGHSTLNYRMSVGSDDDCFRFTPSDDRFGDITIPFAPEMSS